MVVDHDNYNQAFGQQLCARMIIFDNNALEYWKFRQFYFFCSSLMVTVASLSDGHEVVASSSSSLRSGKRISPVFMLQGPVSSSLVLQFVHLMRASTATCPTNS
jgi:hypothetical protein